MDEWQRRANRAAGMFERSRRLELAKGREQAEAERVARESPPPNEPPPSAGISVVRSSYIGARVVYVVWPEGDVFVKIGSTSDLTKRLVELSVGNPRPLYLLSAFEETGLWTERTLQDHFAAHAARGEWFRLDGALAEWLAGALEAARQEGPGVPVRLRETGLARRSTRGG